MKKFIEIFDRDQNWSEGRKHARRTGIAILVHNGKQKDGGSGVCWDPELFIKQTRDENCGFWAWRRDFVETVLALGFVPNLSEMPDASLEQTEPTWKTS